MKSRISSFEYEESDEEDEGDSLDEKKVDQSHTQDAFVEIKITEVTRESDAVSSPSPQLSSPNGLFDQGSQCIEMNSKNFCCISVTPIAG